MALLSASIATAALCRAFGTRIPAKLHATANPRLEPSRSKSVWDSFITELMLMMDTHFQRPRKKGGG